MIEIQGKINTAICFAKVIEDEAIEQIRRMCDYEITAGSQIRIMPDVHAGKGCTIGTTMTVKDKAVPNVVGVDIGCGMYTVNLGQVEIDMEQMDAAAHFIPSGMNVWEGRKERFDLLDLNYVSMPRISETFKRDYLDDEGNRNAILRYNYEDLFVMKLGFGLSYNDGSDAVRANVESSGNLLNSLSHIAKFKTNSNGQNTLFGIAYAQYAKMDVDYTHLFKFDEHNTLAAHIGLGIAYPYGNSKILPFEKRYFSGGANSVRGWTVRGLGPGKFKGKDGRIDFINQTGDMKLDFNLEYRTHMFWKLDGAVFVDAGNIWTLKEYADQPGGKFAFNEFYKQIAVAYGVGLRLNFDYFILRMDMGMKAINPAYESKAEHYALVHPNFSRDFAFHFAVGLPF